MAFEPHQCGINVRRWPEHVAANIAHAFRGAVPGELHARRAVDLGSRLCAEAFGHLFLHHHEEGVEIAESFEQREQNRRRHIVGQIGHQRERRGVGELRQLRRRDLERIHVDHTESVGRIRHELGDRLRQALCQRRIDLHGGEVGAGLENRQGERTEPGTHLHHLVTGVDARLAHNLTHGAGVDHEVLPELLRRRDALFGGDSANIGRSQQVPAVCLRCAHACSRILV